MGRTIGNGGIKVVGRIVEFYGIDAIYIEAVDGI